MIDALSPMQYSKPPAPNQFFGDAMPFFRDGLFHLVILLDEGHHSAFGGLGGHRWAHYTSADFKLWTQHPLILAPGPEGAWDQYGICTGSVYFHDGVFYAFYAARVAGSPGWEQFVGEKVGLARSADGFVFEKEPAPILEPLAGYDRDHRDPFVFRDEATKLFHLLVTTRLLPERVAGAGEGHAGCLAHYTSPDLRQWTPLPPFGGLYFIDTPECPDHFAWNGWFYLLASQNGIATYYLSRSALGPWTRPEVNAFEGPMAAVMRTAEWKNNRRLGVAFIRSRKENRNGGDWCYAGNVVFRELIQQTDGTLGVRFVPEMMPPTGESLPLGFSGGNATEADNVALPADARAVVRHVPLNAQIAFAVRFSPGSSRFSLHLRGDDRGTGGAKLAWDLKAMRISLEGEGGHNAPPTGRPPNIVPLGQDECVTPLAERPHSTHAGPEPTRAAPDPDHAHRIEIIMLGDIIDVCIDDRSCLIDRVPDARGSVLTFACDGGGAEITDLSIRPIAD
jgi:beta-fructofuranosidase